MWLLFLACSNLVVGVNTLAQGSDQYVQDIGSLAASIEADLNRAFPPAGIRLATEPLQMANVNADLPALPAIPALEGDLARLLQEPSLITAAPGALALVQTEKLQPLAVPGSGEPAAPLGVAQPQPSMNIPKAADPTMQLAGASSVAQPQAMFQSDLEREIEKTQRVASFLAQDAQALSQELEALGGALRGTPIKAHAPVWPEPVQQRLSMMQQAQSPYLPPPDASMALEQAQARAATSTSWAAPAGPAPTSTVAAPGAETPPLGKAWDPKSNASAVGGNSTAGAEASANGTGAPAATPEAVSNSSSFFKQYNIKNTFWTMNRHLSDFATVVFWTAIFTAGAACCGWCCLCNRRLRS